MSFIVNCGWHAYFSGREAFNCEWTIVVSGASANERAYCFWMSANAH